jgi:type II secretory pathway pseudopilin PulG
MSLIELMISMLVLAIGLAAITILITTAIGTNNRNSKDTTSTMLAQMVIEEIAAQDPNSGVLSIPITDCAGNAASSSYGAIDQSQAVAAITAGYQMNYVDCSAAGGSKNTYDVRWNVMTISATNTRLITASARLSNSSSSLLGGPLFNLPVNLRGIGGHTQ